MAKIKIKDKSFVPYVLYPDICKAIDEVAARLNNDYKDRKEPPVLLCVLNGSIMFIGELMKRIDFDCEIVSLKLTSYSGTSCTGKVREVMGLTGSVEGKDVIIVEDIVDTGGTIVTLRDILVQHGASDIKVCTMFMKPEVYDKDVNIDYVAMPLKNEFIVGFGLDYEELGRNYKDVYILDK